jgi:hypothetical protein
VILGEEADELPLGEVRVLELVDEDVAEALAPPLVSVSSIWSAQSWWMKAYCAWLVSWYSSTSTWRKRRR